MIYQLNYHRLSIHKLGIVALIGLVISVWVLPVVAEYSAENDPMMRRLFALHSKLANNGNLESVVKLGGMFERGEGIAKDHEKAIQLYKYAADQGNEFALGLLTKAKSEKSKINSDNDISSINIPKSKETPTKESEAAQIQQKLELEIKLQKEKAAAETARAELEALRRAQQQELAAQQRLKAEIEKVQQAQEQIERERAKAEQYRREMELARQKHEEELKAQAENSKTQQAVAVKPTTVNTPPDDQDSEKTNFSSNPCNTPVAKFMSTCN
jgi:hypothetical protein